MTTAAAATASPSRAPIGPPDEGSDDALVAALRERDETAYLVVARAVRRATSQDLALLKKILEAAEPPR